MKTNSGLFGYGQDKWKFIGDIWQKLTVNYPKLTEYRSAHDKIKEARYDSSVVDTSLTVNGDNKQSDILRGHFIDTAVDQAMNYTLMPEFDVHPKSKNSTEDKNKSMVAKSLLQYLVRVSGYEEVFLDSMETKYVFGDCFRSPVVSSVNKKPSIKELKKGKFERSKSVVEYIEYDGYNLLLDDNCTRFSSKSYIRSGKWWAYFEMLTKEDVISLYGYDVLAQLRPNAAIDVNQLSTYESELGESGQEYYERIIYQDKQSGDDIVFLGAGMFPVELRTDRDISLTKEEKKVISFGTYPYRDECGVRQLSLTNDYCFYDSRGVRNIGFGHKLFSDQIANALTENMKLQATRKRMFEIPWFSGSSKIKKSISDMLQSFKTNIFSFLELKQGAVDGKPEVGVIRFEGVPAAEAAQSTNDIYSHARNKIGIDLRRLEVRESMGLGQTQLLEEKTTTAITTINKSTTGIVSRELRSFLSWYVDLCNNETIENHDEISYEWYESEVGDVELPEPILTKNTATVSEACRLLKDFEYDVHIDKSTIVRRMQVLMLDSLTKFGQLVDTSAIPKFAKKMFMKFADSLHINYEETDFDGIENSVAQGGMSQRVTAQAEASGGGSGSI